MSDLLCKYIDCGNKGNYYTADHFRGFFVSLNLCKKHHDLFMKMQAEDPNEETRTIYYHRGVRIN